MCLPQFSVSALLLLTFVSSAKIIQKRDDNNCGTYKGSLVTINKDYEPFWYQKKYAKCIDGNQITEINAITLEVENYDVNKISNFPVLKEIYLDKLKMETLPVFLNLPKIESISLSFNRIQEIKKTVFSHLPVAKLIFSTNRISKIENGSFGSNVEEIYLTCNNLTTLSPKWFLNPAKLNFLNMGGNQITTIPDYMFKDFTNLDHLELRNNQIKTLGIGSISGPKTMSWLQLAYNNISEIKGNVFGTKLSVKRMDVQYNRLSFLHEDMMDKLNVTDFRNWGNPWQCPCRDIILKWIQKNNKDFYVGLTRDEDPNCVYALSFQNSCVPFVDDELYKTFLMNFNISPAQFCNI